MAHAGKILKALREQKRVTQLEVAEALEIDQETVSRLERSATPPKRGSTYRRLIEFYGRKIEDVNGMLGETNTDILESLREQIRPIEQTGASPEYLASIGVTTDPEPGTRVRPIHGGDEIAAGQPISDSADFDPGDPHQFIPGELYPWDDSAFFVRVKGNSMYPEFREGDIVIGSPGLRDQLEGRDCACIRFTKESRFRGGRALKRLREIDGATVTLESLNPDHKPITVPLSEVDSMGPCVVHIRNLWKEHGFAVEEIQRASRVKVEPKHPPGEAPQKHPDYDGPQESSGD